MTGEPFNLERFVEAQGDTYDHALDEIRRGRKASHWMWFIFPQIAGLGLSAISRYYAINSLDEARAYLAHSILGTRYRQCVSTLQYLVGLSAEAVFGSVDAAKLRSSLTLFADAAPDEELFGAALEHWFDGQKDQRTIQMLQADRRSR